MVVYQITCDRCHTFEGRFRQADDYTQQLQRGQLACPVCASRQLRQRLLIEPIVLPRIIEPALAPGGLSDWLQRLRDHLQAYVDLDAAAESNPASAADSETAWPDEELAATPMGPDDICH